jgi:hypothetical protein
MNSKTILNYITLIFAFTLVLVVGGCKSGSEDIEVNIVSETVIVDEDTRSEEKEPETENNSIDQGSVEADQEDSNNNLEEEAEDDDPDSGETEEKPKSIELSASHVGGIPGSITMFFDLITGKVSGNLEMKYTEVSLDGNQTVLCVYFIKGYIKGVVDLETRIINADFIGEADSDDSGCYRGELQFSMKGKIREDYSVARGNTTYGGVDWSVFE